MAVDLVTKKEFNNQITEEKKAIKEIDKDINMLKRAMTSNKKLEPFYRIGIASRNLHQLVQYIEMNARSERMMGVKNSSYLDEAKKKFSTIFTELDKVVTLRTDEPVDFNRENLDKIKPFNPRKKLNFVKHLQKALKELIHAYGENTKWRWSFPDLWSKLVIISKNLLDYREIQSIRDPREEFYYDRQEHLQLVKDMLFEVSNKFRNKFELSSKSDNDLMMAVKLLRDLRSISSVMGDDEMAKKAKSGIDAYMARLEKDKPKKGGAKKRRKKK